MLVTVQTCCVTSQMKMAGLSTKIHSNNQHGLVSGKAPLQFAKRKRLLFHQEMCLSRLENENKAQNQQAYLNTVVHTCLSPLKSVQKLHLGRRDKKSRLGHNQMHQQVFPAVCQNFEAMWTRTDQYPRKIPTLFLAHERYHVQLLVLAANFPCRLTCLCRNHQCYSPFHLRKPIPC